PSASTPSPFPTRSTPSRAACFGGEAGLGSERAVRLAVGRGLEPRRRPGGAADEEMETAESSRLAELVSQHLVRTGITGLPRGVRFAPIEPPIGEYDAVGAPEIPGQLGSVPVRDPRLHLDEIGSRLVLRQHVVEEAVDVGRPSQVARPDDESIAPMTGAVRRV